MYTDRFPEQDAQAMKKIALPFLSAAALFSTAIAQDVSVEIETWMLETDRGAERVYATLEASAQRACRAPVRTASSLRIERQCREELLDVLVENSASDVLRRIHSGTEEVRVAQQ
jgi:UrcA family protein